MASRLDSRTPCRTRTGSTAIFGFHSGCFDYYSHRYYWGEPRTVNYHDLWRDRTEVFEDGQYSTELFGREAARFVRDNRERPFFLYLAFNGPHYPDARAGEIQGALSGARTGAPDLRGDDRGGGRRRWAAWCVRCVRTACWTTHLIFFTGDNGATREARAGLNQKPATAGNNAPFRGNKFSAFDGGMHVPMIMHWPGVIPGRTVVREVGSHLDLLPTICESRGSVAAGGPHL